MHQLSSRMWLRVKDGLFIGGEEASEDLESAQQSKVTRVVNCCAAEIPNRWALCGMKYLSYRWSDDSDQVILDTGDFVVNDVYDFIEAALANSEAVLIHSLNGESRSVCILLAYFMKKYRWCLKKATQFLEARQLEMHMNDGFHEQLESFEIRLARQAGPLETGWEELPGSKIDGEELLLRNTFLNAHLGLQRAEPPLQPRDGEARSISWSDNCTDNRILLEDPFSEEETREAKKQQSQSAALVAVRPALKGAAGLAEATSVQGTPASATAESSPGDAISIRTKAGTVICRPDEIVCKRIGLRFDCNRIVLEYAVPARSLKVIHRIDVNFEEHAEGLKEDSTAAVAQSGGPSTADLDIAARLQNAHAKWLSSISVDQLARLVTRLRRGDAGI